jgi:hypothetical protein
MINIHERSMGISVDSAGDFTLKSSFKKVFIVIVLGMTVLVVGLCVFFRISHPRDILAYAAMAGEVSPVWKPFAFRRFGLGDSADRLFLAYPPSEKEEFGQYGVYTYYYSPGSKGGIGFTGLWVTAKDGKLTNAAAWSCTWRFLFFDTKDPEFERAYEAFKKQRQQRLDR